jgi:homocysteine S-methyltransferase
MTTMHQRLADGEILILDGATGTELQRRGVPMHDEAWSAAALISHPQVVQAVHEDYIRVGADIIITNTFSTGRLLLQRADLAGRVRELNLKAVELAQAARAAAAGDRPIYIAGSISVWDYDSSADVARAAFQEQADVLAEGGVDLIALEMMEDVQRAALAIQAAVATGLPVWVGYSVKRAPDGTIVLLHSQDDFRRGLDELLPLGGAGIAIMHSLPQDVGPALAIVRERWQGPLGAYAHMGTFTMPNWHWVNMLTPEEYLAEAHAWAGHGVQVIGGCCGLGPEYISLLKQRLPSHL